MRQRKQNGGADSRSPEIAPPRDPVVGWTTLITGIAITIFLYWRNHDLSLPMGFDEYNLLNTAIILWIPLVIILLGLRREPSEFGFTVGDLGKGMPFVAVAFLLFIPVIVLFAPQSGAQSYYIEWLSSSRAVVNVYWLGKSFTPGVINYGRLAYHELVMGFYMFGWEFFFRGFLLNGLRRLVPLWAAILLQAVLFTALHYSKPPLETISSFPGAIILALLAIRSRSFVPCFVLHFGISMGFDFAVLYAHFHQ